LYFLIKVADEKGTWLEGGTYHDFPLPSNLDKSQAIQFDSGLYLRPGSYMVAMMVYDRIHKAGNLKRERIFIKAPKKDPLPLLDRDLLPVEFITEVPHDSLQFPNHTVRFPQTRPIPEVSPENDQSWPLASGREWLPISNTRPIQLDLVMDFSGWVDPALQNETSAPTYRQDVGRVLQIGDVLSHLQLNHGCVRVSAVDVLRMRTIFDRVPESRVHWDKLREDVMKGDQNLINAAVLENRKRAPEFFSRFLNQLTGDSDICSAGDNPLRVVIVTTASGVQFPGGLHLERTAIETGCACRFYYFRPAVVGPNDVPEDVERMLKHAGAQRFVLSNPLQFRKAVADMTVDITSASSNVPIH
jgi:hypothetical protein